MSAEEKSIFTTNHFNSDKMIKYKYEGVDDIFSHIRYETFQKENFSNYDLNNLRELLSGDRGFICQYDREKGFDTIWSTIYDVKNKKVYRCEGNPSRKRWKEDKRLKFIY